jgi:hypothetical protein
LFQQRTTVYHLHGVKGEKDHLSLGRLETEAGATLAPILEQFHGTVSLEVFSHRHLTESLDSLALLMSRTADYPRESIVG